nr:hypothetical protein [Methylorubrum zatmanii]
MNFPHLERHRNGMYYIHWTDGRRSKRESTKTDERRTALIALAHWILERYADNDGASDAVCKRAR